LFSADIQLGLWVLLLIFAKDLVLGRVVTAVVSRCLLSLTPMCFPF
jgi:hypothetical protein